MPNPPTVASTGSAPLQDQFPDARWPDRSVEGRSSAVAGGVALLATTNNTPLDERIGRLVKDYPRDMWAKFELSAPAIPRRTGSSRGLRILSSLPSEDRELLTAITVDGVSNFRNTIRSTTTCCCRRRFGRFWIWPIDCAAKRSFRSRRWCCATRSMASGSTNRSKPRTSQANKDTRTVVYCEVENFSSQKNDKQLWETKLKQQVVLYTETGMQVWRADAGRRK